MKRVALYTKSRLLHRRISLILKGIAEVDMTEGGTERGYSVTLVDRESFPEMEAGVSLPHEIRDGALVNLPISHSAIIALVDEIGGNERSLILLDETRSCAVSGRTVKLTEVEYKLLARLEQSGGFVSREELLRSVWDGKKDIGVVNVYVHYLREKLETSGEKIIISSRKEGYKIDEKYKGRTANC